MIAVGIREIKNKLSEYVRRASNGEVILVTDRGRVVAQLVKPGSDTPGLDDPIARMEADGLLSRRGGANHPDLYADLEPVVAKGASLTVLDELRGDR
jgi:antitoxin (DNA-binding transcriptional repressor) of toxin-antitoxin stability system